MTYLENRQAPELPSPKRVSIQKNAVEESPFAFDGFDLGPRLEQKQSEVFADDFKFAAMAGAPAVQAADFFSFQSFEPHKQPAASSPKQSFAGGQSLFDFAPVSVPAILGEGPNVDQSQSLAQQQPQSSGFDLFDFGVSESRIEMPANNNICGPD